MIGKRIGTLLLAAGLAVSSVPITAQKTAAQERAVLTEGDTSYYKRETPEVALLNIRNGENQKFYENNVAVSGSHYNAIHLFENQGVGEPDYLWYERNITPDMVDEGNNIYVWDGWDGSVIEELCGIPGNMSFNTSNTFTNNWHTHTQKKMWGILGSTSQETLACMGMYLTINGNIYSYHAGNQDDMHGDVRVGNNVYDPAVGLSSTENSAKVTFIRSQVETVTGLCTCSGAMADKHVVAFFDRKAPVVREVAGTVTEDRYFKEGEEITVILMFDEPIRFSDDNPAAHTGDNTPYVTLQMDGMSAENSPKAMLTKLDNDTMYFSYTVEEGIGEKKISYLDFTSLYGDEEWDLVHVIGDETFTVEVPDKADSEGYTTSSCLITDLAGNAMTDREVAVTAYMDTVYPTVSKILGTAFTYNTDVKQALGKTDPSSKDYQDASDLYLAPGDTLNYEIYMSEELRLEGQELPDTGIVQATTNLMDADGNPVILNGKHSYRIYAESGYGLGASNGVVTMFILEPYDIEEGTRYENSADDMIRIKKLEFLDDVTDWCDNPVLTVLLDENAGQDVIVNESTGTVTQSVSVPQYRLDGTDPYVGLVLEENTEDTVQLTRSGDSGVRAVIRIGDSTDGTEDGIVSEGDNRVSGVNGLNGWFMWNADNNNVAYQFEYVVTASESEPDDEDYEIGRMNTSIPFTQVYDKVYLHLRPAEGEMYDLSSSTLLVGASDYAGNQTPAASSQNVKNYHVELVWDNIAPTVRAGDVTRTLDGTAGIMSVKAELTDNIGLSAAYYAWGDDREPDDNDWDILGDITEGADSAEVSASATVPSGENYTGTLWIKAVDTEGNAAVVCLGAYSYNMELLEYALSYAAGITDKAHIQVDNSGEGKLAFLIKDPSAENDYFLCDYDDDYAATDLFSSAYYWTRVTVIEENGKYTFIKTEDNQDMTWLDTIIGGAGRDDCTYSGNLPIFVIAGQPEAFIYNEGSNMLNGAGTDSHAISTETVILRVSSVEESAADAFNMEDTALTPDGDFSAVRTTSGYTMGDDPLRNTLGGISFKMEMGEDLNGWNYEDIDWANSYLQMTTKLNTVSEPIKKQVPLQASPVQIITIPEGEYETGWWEFSLHIACHAGKSYDIPCDIPVFVDSTPVVTAEEFSITEIRYDPYLYSYESVGYVNEVKVTGKAAADYYHHDKTWNGEEAANYADAEADTIWFPTSYSTGSVIRFTHSVKVNNQDVMLYSSYTSKYTSDTTDEKEYSTYYLEYDVRVWNVTAGETVDSRRANQNLLSGYRIRLIDNADDLSDVESQEFPLIADTANVIAMQIFNSNGKSSEILYQTLYPIAGEITGTVTSTTHENGGNVVSEGKLIFTPDEGNEALLSGAAVYSNIIAADGTPVLMTPQADGTYTCDLTPEYNGIPYAVYVVDAYGGYHFIGMEQADIGDINGDLSSISASLTLCDASVVDNEAPVIAVEQSAIENGNSFTATYTITDDSLKAGLPMEITFRFNDDYASRLDSGTETMLRLPVEWDNFGRYNWMYSDSSETGIIFVEAERGTDGTAKVLVKGYVREDTALTDPAAKLSMTLYMDVQDAFGYTASAEIDYSGITNDTAYILPDGVKLQNSLSISFNSPVKPVASWSNPSPIYSETHSGESGGFPVTADGTWTLKYYDIFGVLQEEELILENVFGDYGVEISFSQEDPTTDPVTVTASMVHPEASTNLAFFDSGRTNPLTEEGDTVSVTAEKNQSYLLRIFPEPGMISADSSHERWSDVKEITVYVTNIIDAPPAAELYFYFDQYGDTYTLDELPQGETTGYVRVTYTTNRYTMPTGGTESERILRHGDPDSYTFLFEDSFGMEGSAFFDLSDLGVTIGAAPAPEPDTEAPMVTYLVSPKVNGSFRTADQMESDAGEQEITDLFKSMGYIQAYSLTVRVKDDSDYKILLLKDKPDTLDYHTAVSDFIDGAVLTGNTITVTKNVSFTVAVVDAGGRFTAITIPAAMSMDNTPPTVEVSYIQLTHYSKMAYIRLTDTDDSGAARTDECRIVSPALQRIEDSSSEYYGAWMMEFSANGAAEIIAADASGNMTNYRLEVTDMDTSSAVLTVTWTPSREITDGEGNIIGLDLTQPTNKPVNKPVTAQIISDKPISGMKAQYSLDGEQTWQEYTGTAGEPVEIRYTTDIIVVTFLRGCAVTIMADAPNRTTAVQNLYLAENIVDMDAPVCQVYENPLTRPGYTVPYAMELLIETDEPVRASGAEDPQKWYNEKVSGTIANPLKITRAVNGTVMMTLSDEAGNISMLRHTVQSLDNTMPEITMDPADTLGMPLTGGSVTVQVTVNEDSTLSCGGTTYTMTAGVSQTLTFTENGYYEVEVADKAGNMAYTVISIGNIDKVKPSIDFTGRTITVLQDTEPAEIDALLQEGVQAWDNRDDAPAWTYNMTGVNPAVPGVYTVPYTVMDAAGNSDTEMRYVRVQDKNRICIRIDGIMTEEGGTTVLSAGSHQALLVNLKKISAGTEEPYVLKIREGIVTAGQMKYYDSTVAVAPDGSFTIGTSGFYTIYAVSQSRQSCLTYVYIEQ